MKNYQKLLLAILWTLPLSLVLSHTLHLGAFYGACAAFSLGVLGFLITNYLMENSR